MSLAGQISNDMSNVFFRADETANVVSGTYTPAGGAGVLIRGTMKYGENLSYGTESQAVEAFLNIPADVVTVTPYRDTWHDGTYTWTVMGTVNGDLQSWTLRLVRGERPDIF
jgi:hypothetical protein